MFLRPICLMDIFQIEKTLQNSRNISPDKTSVTQKKSNALRTQFQDDMGNIHIVSIVVLRI